MSLGTFHAEADDQRLIPYGLVQLKGISRIFPQREIDSLCRRQLFAQLPVRKQFRRLLFFHLRSKPTSFLINYGGAAQGLHGLRKGQPVEILFGKKIISSIADRKHLFIFCQRITAASEDPLVAVRDIVLPGQHIPGSHKEGKETVLVGHQHHSVPQGNWISHRIVVKIRIQLIGNGRVHGSLPNGAVGRHVAVDKVIGQYVKSISSVGDKHGNVSPGKMLLPGITFLQIFFTAVYSQVYTHRDQKDQRKNASSDLFRKTNKPEQKNPDQQNRSVDRQQRLPCRSAESGEKAENSRQQQKFCFSRKQFLQSVSANPNNQR